MPLSLTAANVLALAHFMLSCSRGTGSTLYSLNRVAIMATNSTCPNFLPGHTRGPPDHGA